ncbi:ubiquinol-cytochrome-c reductase complex subunit-domain-containing protein [Camillea tinctor]|nr:ubiquinol-cytochrome-c reductase complex subunit-domain-containing protein [Camillea tinctor]
MVFPTPIRRVEYPTYKSPYGPKYHYQPNVAGWTMKQFAGLGIKSGAFGGVALFAVIFYASGIPRVQKDILQKVPFIGSYFINEIPASDNPF